MRRPLLILAAAFAAGATLGGGLPVAWAAAHLAFSAVLLAVAWRAPPRPALVALGASALALGAAGAAAEWRAFDRAPLVAWADSNPGVGPVLLTGRLRADPRERGERWELRLDVEQIARAGCLENARGGARVLVGGRALRPRLIQGDRVRLWAALDRPRRFKTPGAFDAVAQARREGIHLVGTTKSAQLVESLGRGEGSPLAHVAARARAWSRARLAEAIPPGPEQALTRAMVIGERTAVEEDTAEAFRIAGTYHVLALSGAQVALLAGLIGAGARLFRLAPVPRAALVCGAMAFYASFVGGDTPVVRAAVMAIAVVAGRALDLDGDAANLLGLAAILLAAARPSSVEEVGFQLSFVATLGLITLTPIIAKALPPLPLGLRTAIAGSLAAQAALLPLLAAHFHRLAPAAVVLNLLAVPLSAAVLLAGFGVVAASGVSTALAHGVGLLAWGLARALLATGEVVRLAPWLDIRGPSPAFLVTMASALALVGIGLRRRRALAVWGAASVALALGWGPRTVDGRLHVAFLDVGQGDAIVLRSPRGRTLVVDAGASFAGGLDLGEAVVGPYLWHEGIRRVDRLVLTHAHPDHVGGAPFLLRPFGVREVWEAVGPRADPGYRALDQALRESRVARRGVRRGVSERWDGVDIEVLGPAPAGGPPWRTRNDDSLVLRVSYGRIALLLTGDLEKAGELRLPAGPVFALKVPHHGSRSSSTPELLARGRPQVAVVSVGERSPFGHPHPEVMARYAARGIRVYRTDRDGAVELATDGERVWASTFADGWNGRIH